MKKIFLGLIIIAAIFVTACDPIEDRDTMTGSISADELDVSVTLVVIDGMNTNKVIMESDNDVLFSWNYGIGISQEYSDTALLVITGEQTIKYIVLNGDGTQTIVEKTVNVDTLYYEVDPQWGYLCGTGEKTWVWDDTQSSAGQNSGTDGPVVYGTGGYQGSIDPDWWNISLPDVDAQAAGEGDGASMVFSVNGATLTKNYSTGSSTDGTFSFDMSATTGDGNGGIWASGQLKTSEITVLAGILLEDGSDVKTYDILSLDDDYMSLSAAPSETGSWGQATFWMFKAE